MTPAWLGRVRLKLTHPGLDIEWVTVLRPTGTGPPEDALDAARTDRERLGQIASDHARPVALDHGPEFIGGQAVGHRPPTRSLYPAPPAKIRLVVPAGRHRGLPGVTEIIWKGGVVVRVASDRLHPRIAAGRSVVASGWPVDLSGRRRTLASRPYRTPASWHGYAGPTAGVDRRRTNPAGRPWSPAAAAGGGARSSRNPSARHARDGGTARRYALERSRARRRGLHVGSWRCIDAHQNIRQLPPREMPWPTRTRSHAAGSSPAPVPPR